MGPHSNLLSSTLPRNWLRHRNNSTASWICEGFLGWPITQLPQPKSPHLSFSATIPNIDSLERQPGEPIRTLTFSILYNFGTLTGAWLYIRLLLLLYPCVLGVKIRNHDVTHYRLFSITAWETTMSELHLSVRHPRLVFENASKNPITIMCNPLKWSNVLACEGSVSLSTQSLFKLHRSQLFDFHTKLRFQQK
jgi:hypothetical protein